jgi:outer membrane immunogenic protein
MKRVVIACVGLLALAGGSATAADLPRYGPVAQAPGYYNPIYNWTGFYLGINGGGGWGQSQWDGVGTFDVSGGVIGGTIGYNWQVNQIVVGAEGDIDWSGIKGTTTVLCAPGCETRNKWLATVRGRLGYAFDRFLPYITGGLAVGDINATVPVLPGGSISNAGWTIGAGLEVGVVSNVSLKAEYLYVDLGNFNCGLNCGLAPGGNVSFNANLVRGGLNVRF